MTQEYEFFKDFAGVTKADLEMFKCGGGMKKKVKKENGGPLKKKKEAPKTYEQWTQHFAPKQKVADMKDVQNTYRIMNEQKKEHDEKVKHIRRGYDRRLDTPTNEDQNQITKEIVPNKKHKKK